MDKPLRALIIAGADGDARQLQQHLAAGGYAVDARRVDTSADLGDALDDGSWDIVLADAAHRRLHVREAARLFDERRIDPPVIVIANEADEASVITMIEAGARGLVPRSNMSHLIPAVERELERAWQRAQGRRAMEALAESERLMASVFDSTQDGISILDRELNIVRVNAAIERWYAHAVPLTGKKCYVAYQCRGEPCEVCPVCRTLESGEGANDTVPKRGREGTIVGWVDLHSFPLLDSGSGEMWGVIEYVRDISDSRRAEEALRANAELFRLMAANVRDMLYRYRLRPTRGFEYVSPSAIDITGYTPEEHYADPDIGQRIVHREDAHYWRQLMTDPESIVAPLELRMVRKDGELVWTEERTSFIRDEFGNVVAIEGVVRDITERKKTEQLKSDLVAMVSHELRAPLASIIGYSSLLQGRNIHDSEGGALFDKAVEKISSQAKHMNRLVENLLEVARIESGDLRLALHETDAQELAADCIEGVTQDDKPAIEVCSDKDLPALTCDAARLSWAITNIISNAFKFSPDGGTITVSLRAVDDRMQISVSDEGVGIAPEDLARIFDRFTQSDMSATRAFGGFGMGLYTAKVVVEAHGGHIEVESEQGTGSTFTIDIPIAGPA